MTASEVVIRFHKENGDTPSYAGNYVGRYSVLPDDDTLQRTYESLVAEGKLEEVGFGYDPDSNCGRPTYRLRNSSV